MVLKSVLWRFTLFCREFFVAIYALLCGEKLCQKLCVWRKKDKYQVWSIWEEDCSSKSTNHELHRMENSTKNWGKSVSKTTSTWLLSKPSEAASIKTISTFHCCQNHQRNQPDGNAKENPGKNWDESWERSWLLPQATQLWTWAHRGRIFKGSWASEPVVCCTVGVHWRLSATFSSEKARDGWRYQ